jgi:hypothetical protein
VQSFCKRHENQPKYKWRKFHVVLTATYFDILNERKNLSSPAKSPDYYIHIFTLFDNTFESGVFHGNNVSLPFTIIAYRSVSNTGHAINV